MIEEDVRRHALIDCIEHNVPLTTELKHRFANLDVNYAIMRELNQVTGMFARWRPLAYACEEQSLPYVQWLLEDMGADPNYTPSAAYMPQLRLSLLREQIVGIFILLLRHGARVDGAELDACRVNMYRPLGRFLFRRYRVHHNDIAPRFMKIAQEVDDCNHIALIVYVAMKLRLGRDMATLLSQHAYVVLMND